MEIEVLRNLLELGGLAVLSIIIFFMYRRDRLSSEKRLSNLLHQDQLTREEHTKALQELITLVSKINGRD